MTPETDLPPALVEALAAVGRQAANLPPEEVLRTIEALDSIRTRLLVRIALNGSNGAHNDPPDDALKVKEAAGRLGVEPGYLRREGERLDQALREATGDGFLLRWSEGTVRYSAKGIEALKAWWRRTGGHGR